RRTSNGPNRWSRRGTALSVATSARGAVSGSIIAVGSAVVHAFPRHSPPPPSRSTAYSGDVQRQNTLENTELENTQREEPMERLTYPYSLCDPCRGRWAQRLARSRAWGGGACLPAVERDNPGGAQHAREEPIMQETL